MPVTLAARCTEIGTLELWCVAREGSNRWRLEFNVRDIVKDDRRRRRSGRRASRRQSRPDRRLARGAGPGGGPADPRVPTATDGPQPAPQELTKALEAALDAPRHDWPTGLCRRLWEFLAEVAEQRRRSPAHLSRWYHLVGYCLRPGFGDPLDRFRVEQLWKLLHAPPRAEPGRTVRPGCRKAGPTTGSCGGASPAA